MASHFGRVAAISFLLSISMSFRQIPPEVTSRDAPSCLRREFSVSKSLLGELESDLPKVRGSCRALRGCEPRGVRRRNMAQSAVIIHKRRLRRNVQELQLGRHRWSSLRRALETSFLFRVVLQLCPECHQLGGRKWRRDRTPSHETR